MFGVFYRRLKTLWRRPQFERELEEEMRLHVDLRARTTGDVDAAARRFGNATLLREQSREQWSFAWVEASVQDVLYAFRTLRRSPGFSVAVIGTLALGLGLNTAVFTLVSAYVLRPLAVHDPSSLYQVGLHAQTRSEFAFDASALNDLSARTDVFSEVLAIDSRFASLDGHICRAAIISDNYFSMLGGRTALGRPIQPGDSDDELVLSDRAWRSWYGADAGILGKMVTVGKYRFEVVGVAQPEFAGVELGSDFWMPMQTWRRTAGQLESNFAIVGRLRPGLTSRQAETALALYARLATADRPEADRAQAVELRSRAAMFELPPRLYLALVPLFAAFAFTMAIPCANVTNMVLARGLARQREIGVRLSIGARRSRLVLQLLTEGLVLAIAAGLLGLLIARLAIDASFRVLYATTPPPARAVLEILTPDMPLDWRVFLFAMTLAALATLAFSLVPALQATRLNITNALRGEFSSLRVSRLRDGLVVLQIGACLMFLLNAVLMVRALERVARLDTGYDTRSVFSLANYTPIHLPETVAALEREPWVDVVAHASGESDVRAGASGKRQQFGTLRYVSPTYFDVFRIRVTRGRAFSKEEASSGAAVAVISTSAAARLWPGEDALGKVVQVESDVSRQARRSRIKQFPQARVVGIAGDTRPANPFQEPNEVQLYFPARTADSESVYVRGKSDAPQTARLFEQAWKRIATPDEAAAVFSLEQRQYWDAYPARAFSWVASLLGIVALVLTISGVYGVISYVVSQRSKEIALRVALGAGRMRVISSILGRLGKLTAVGLVVGGTFAAAVSKVMWAHTPLINPFDPIAYLLAPTIVIGATLVASAGPARRATRVEPAAVLRAD